MLRLVAVQSSGRRWRWACVRCGQVDLSWYPSRDHALAAGRGHAGIVHAPLIGAMDVAADPRLERIAVGAHMSLRPGA